VIKGLYARVPLGTGEHTKDSAHRLMRVETLHKTDKGMLLEVLNMRKVEKVPLAQVGAASLPSYLGVSVHAPPSHTLCGPQFSEHRDNLPETPTAVRAYGMHQAATSARRAAVRVWQ
jgi:hypothetical protein